MRWTEYVGLLVHLLEIVRAVLLVQKSVGDPSQLVPCSFVGWVFPEHSLEVVAAFSEALNVGCIGPGPLQN